MSGCAKFNPNEHQHVRFNPLRGEWILVSPHRMLRPWSGQVEPSSPSNIPEFDPANPLCPGVTRTSGIVTPNYESTFVFTNDFPALLEEGPSPPEESDPLFQIKDAKGTCKVMCFHPKSNRTLPIMTITEIRAIIDEWINQITVLGQKYNWVQIFENKGAMMGCSNPHPHCQIWASSFLPNEPRIKDIHLRHYYCRHQRPMLIDYVEREIEREERIVCSNNDWVVVVPWWALWPFETMVLPRKQVERFTDLSEDQKNSLADIIKRLVIKYDNIFQCSFPYSMGWHGAPTGEHLSDNMKHWTFHGLYYPPLLRSASVKKFMVGFELLAQGQRDLTPEKAATVLRNQPGQHYSTV